MSSAIERAFFDRIRDEPSDDAPRLIYADWLDENGQPERAEFIRIQCALDRLPDDDPSRAELRERERVLSEANEARWTAEISSLATLEGFRRGIIDSVSLDPNQFLCNGERLFDIAPIRKVRLHSLGDRLAKIVQSPLLRLVRELDLTGNDVGNTGPVLLARSPHLQGLHALNLSFSQIGDKGLQALALSPVFGSLRILELCGNDRLGIPGIRALAESPHLTELMELDVSGNGLSAPALMPLFAGPRSERLVRLALGHNRLGDEGTAALVESPVFARIAERYGEISLHRVEMGPVGARALANSPALAHVESLDLQGNVLGDAGLIALAASPYLKKLRVLSLRDNRIGDAGVNALARSPLIQPLRILDLTGNIIKQDSQDRLHEASIKHDWRGLLQLKMDSQQLRTRPAGYGVLFRRNLS